MGDGQTDRDSGWSEQYAETGGWPPPAAGQRRYEPGAPPPADPTRPAGGREDGEAGPTGQSGYDPAGRRGQPAGGPGTGGPAQHGDRPATPWTQPAGGGESGGAGQYGGPAYGDGQAYGAADPWGQPPGPETGTGGHYGTAGQPAGPWASGDSAYGRLTGRTPPPRQRPRRPWDGRPAPAARSGRTPVVTYTLIAICVVVYLVQQADPGFTGRYALIPIAVEQGQYARLVTSAFLHASLLHLATNMITLYIVGTPLERVLGPARYLAVYLLSALGGSLLSVWLSPGFSIGVGASGAIFGLFGALVVLRRQVGAETGGLAVLIGLNLVISFAVPNISWQAHIGGLVTGVLVALAMAGTNRLRRRPSG